VNPRDALAVYRLTRAWLDDTHDFPPTAALRARASEALSGTRWEALDTCAWCSSAWIGAGVLVARRVAPRAWSAASWVLAASAAAGLLRNVEQALAAVAERGEG